MKTGTVKFYNETRFWFYYDTSPRPISSFTKGLIDSIREDMEFEVKEGKKGPNVVNVKKTEG